MLIDDLVGTWDMVHDGWRGTLVINPSDQLRNAVDDPCTYRYYVIDGVYTTSGGEQFAMSGTFGGKDLDQHTGDPCPQSDHLLNVTIEFPGEPPQPFIGYLFTHEGKGMGGRTWWQDIPFGWYAVKREAAPPVSPLTLRSELAAVKVRPQDPVTNAGVTAQVKGARGEGVAVQVVLNSSADLNDLVPELTALTAPDGTTLAAQAVQLYRVGYLNAAAPSDAAGASGEWPDPLYPIGPDRYFGEPRNGAPFSLMSRRSQPVWVEIRIPRDAAAGTYSATFLVRQSGTGAVMAELPLQLTVWDFTLPQKSSLPTSYQFSMGGTSRYHNPTNGQTPQQLAQLYLAEAAAHRVTFNVVDAFVNYAYANGQLSNVDWLNWDPFFEGAEVTSYPIPLPNAQRVPFNSANWDAAQTAEVTAFWQEVARHYEAKGWLSANYLYTKDEPRPADYPINNRQSSVLHGADNRLKSLVTHIYDAGLVPGAIDIWVPIINQLERNLADYNNERAQGRQVWWYDSNNSNQTDANGQFGNWPDEFVDHPGVNQLIHGPMTWKFGLNGYLYYATTLAYYNATNCTQPLDPWRQLACFGANGDGTLFYPGTPTEIGGTSHIPVPSIRLQLLRQSWAIYDTLVLLRDAGKTAQADQIVNALVTNSSTWSHNPQDYETAREAIAAALLS